MTDRSTPAPVCWPGIDPADLSQRQLPCPTGPVTVPAIDPDGLERSLAALRRARRAIEDRPVRELVAALDRCAAAWCERDDPCRQAALEWLGTTTGCAPTMLSPALTATFEALREPHLSRLLAGELGGTDVLDGGLDDGGRRLRAVGPRLTWLIGAGIVPNAVAVPVFTALLCKSAVLVKTPTREPTFGALLARSLGAVDGQLGACVAAGWWPGDGESLNARAAAAADAIVVTGTDDTVRAVQARVNAATRVVAYGDRVSLIAVGRERLAADQGGLMWMQIAEAVGWYEQQGCLSPHVVYLEEGGALSPLQAAAQLADAMALYENKAPRGPVTPETAAALETYRQRADARAIDPARARVWAAAATGATWTVAFDTDPHFARSPGHRFIHVRPVYDLEDLPALLQRANARFQAVGLEVDATRRAVLAEAFTRLDVSRVCTVAALQQPPVSWPRDGHPVIREFLRWVEQDDVSV